MQKTFIYLTIIFFCIFALIFRWMNPPPVAQKIEAFEEKAQAIVTATPALIITKSETKNIKRTMPIEVLREQNEDPSFLPFDELGNLYIENVMLDEQWAIAHGDVLVGVASEVLELEANGQPLFLPKPRLWDKGIIPFIISNNISDNQKQAIREAISILEENTPIRFQENKNIKDHLVFKSGGKHCYSYVGKVGGAQDLVLGPDCRTPQILHELLHALGLYHEQSRPDRDDHIMIMWENIQEQYHEQFKKMPPLHYAVSEVEFDTTSIMMYPPQAFAREPGDTSILTIDGELYQPKQTLSASDILKIKKLYEFED